MADIFISYAREDQEVAQQLAGALEAQGWSVFWDRTIPAGETWRSYTGKALEEARCVLVAWSAASIVSDFVHDEADDAKERDILIPIFIESVAPPIGFRAVQAANLVGWNGDARADSFVRFRDDVVRLLGAPPTLIDEQEGQQVEGSHDAEIEARREIEQEQYEQRKDEGRTADSDRKPNSWMVWASVIGLAVVVIVLSRFWPVDPIALTVYVVRHAEMDVSVVPEDPGLSDEGKIRAEALADVMQDVKLDAIYSTPFRRTMETVQPIAERLGLKVTLNDASDMAMLAEELRNSGLRSVLVCQHTNTVPWLIEELGVEDASINLKGVYDRVFVLTVIAGRKTEIAPLRFGAIAEPEK